MTATRMRGAKLAVHQNPSPVDERTAVLSLKSALLGVLTGTRPFPAEPWDDVARREPRSSMPFARERDMLHAAIRQGRTTPEKVMAYRLAQMQDDLAQFTESPLLEAILYKQLITEEADALDAQSIEHALPSRSHLDRAVEATERVARDAQAFCTLARC